MLPTFKPPSGRLRKKPRAPVAGEPGSLVTIPAPVPEARGLGDVVKRATSALGIEACSGCQRRAEALNRWISFRPIRGERG